MTTIPDLSESYNSVRNVVRIRITQSLISQK